MAGRPTKYTNELLEAAGNYLVSGYVDKDAPENEKECFPSIAGLANHLGISRQTVYAWASEPGKESFSDILESILAKQELMLLNNGLRGTFNATIAKLALGKHGYSDKTDNTHGGTDGGPIEVASIERRIVKA